MNPWNSHSRFTIYGRISKINFFSLYDFRIIWKIYFIVGLECAILMGYNFYPQRCQQRLKICSNNINLSIRNSTNLLVKFNHSRWRKKFSEDYYCLQLSLDNFCPHIFFIAKISFIRFCYCIFLVEFLFLLLFTVSSWILN